MREVSRGLLGLRALVKLIGKHEQTRQLELPSARQLMGTIKCPGLSGYAERVVRQED